MTSEIPWTSMRALSFDIYGTLIDWNTGMIDSLRSTSLGPFLPDTNDELLRGINKHSADLERDGPSMKKSAIHAESLRRYAIDLDLAERGHLSTSDIDAAAQEHGSSIGQYKAFPDTVSSLNRLSKHYRIIALSNIDHASLESTLRQNFEGFEFDACYIAEDIGTYKPNRANFDYLVDHLRDDHAIDRKELCHVAQSLFHDHPTTKQMGMQSVWLDRYGILPASRKSSQEMQLDYGYKLRVTSLSQLADVVDTVFAK